MLVLIQGERDISTSMETTNNSEMNRIRNKAKLKAVELVDPRNTELRSILQRAEYAITAGDDVVEEDDDEGPTGSASDSE
jgi:hypothetical protein